MSGDFQSSRANSTPDHVENIVRLTSEVLEDQEEVNINSKGFGQNGKGNQSRKGPNEKINHSGKGSVAVKKQMQKAVK